MDQSPLDCYLRLLEHKRHLLHSGEQDSEEFELAAYWCDVAWDKLDRGEKAQARTREKEMQSE